MNTNTTLSKGSSIQLNERRAARAGMLLLLLLLPFVAQAQFTYTTNNGTITITKYTGPVTAVTIPDTINGLPVTSIDRAFYNGATPGPGILTSITIPDSVTSIEKYAFAWNYTLTSATLGKGIRTIGDGAFGQCGLTGVYFLGDAPSLGGPSVFFGDLNFFYVYYVPGTSGWGPTFGGCPTARWNPQGGDYSYTTNNGRITITGYFGLAGDVAIPDTIGGLPVTSIGSKAFYNNWWGLTSVTIPDSVISIGNSAFDGCEHLISATIPSSAVSIGDSAFQDCVSLTSVYCRGDAPGIGLDLFIYDNNTTVYYLPGTTGWGTSFGGRPTALWLLPNPLILKQGSSFGVKTNRFGFSISWAAHASVVVEASTNLANPTWSPVATNTLTSGTSYFSDPQWTNYPSRLFRVRSP